jgi:hypothetical protein
MECMKKEEIKDFISYIRINRQKTERDIGFNRHFAGFRTLLKGLFHNNLLTKLVVCFIVSKV